MQNKTNTFAEDLRLIKKGYQLLFNVVGKGFYIFKVISVFLNIAIPYVDVYFAARLVNELAGDKDKDRILMYVYLILGSTIVLNLLATTLHTVYLCFETEDWTKIAFHYSKKSLALDYPDLESDYINSLISTSLCHTNRFKAIPY